VSILILILILLFGLAPLSQGTSTVETVEAVGIGPLTVDGAPVTNLAVEPMTGEATYVATAGSLYRADGAGEWTAAGMSPNLETMVVDSRNPERIWAGTGLDCYRGDGVSLSLMRSDDGGATWAEVGPAGYVPLASWDPGNVVIAHDCSGLQVSVDGGATWAMPEGLPLGSQVTAFAILSPPEAAGGLNVLAGVTGEGGTSQLYRVYLGDPAAVEVHGPLQTYYGIGSLAIEPGGAILLGAPQGVLRSDDWGETWTTSRAGLESTTLERDPIEEFPTDLEPGSFGLPAMVTAAETTYVAGVDGVYRLSGDAQAWEKVADLDAAVTTLAAEPGTGVLLVRTDAGEVLRLEVASHGT
jgi:hypothetical protein